MQNYNYFYLFILITSHKLTYCIENVKNYTANTHNYKQDKYK